MLTVEQAKEIMNNHGFSEVMRGMEGNEVSSITFSTDKLDGTDFTCIINLTEESFEFQYCCPHSINILICGPWTIYTHDRFMQFYRKFKKHVRAIHCEETD